MFIVLKPLFSWNSKLKFYRNKNYFYLKKCERFASLRRFWTHIDVNFDLKSKKKSVLLVQISI